MIKLNDFLKPELLGNKFVAIKGYSEVKDRETGQLSAYRLNVSIQEDNDFFMELITVKVKNINPTLGFKEMEQNKTAPVTLQNLQVGQFNGTLWFSCDDVLPAK